MRGEGKVGDAGKPASRWYRRDGPVPTVRNAISAPLLQRGGLSPTVPQLRHDGVREH